MKILLDECLPLDFRHSFLHHDAHTDERLSDDPTRCRSKPAPKYNQSYRTDDACPELACHELIKTHSDSPAEP